VQKLEEVMRAEEGARHIVADARERASALVRDAERSASDLLAAERGETARMATATRERHLEEARTQAVTASNGAEEASANLLAEARLRVDAAVEVALERLQG